MITVKLMHPDAGYDVDKEKDEEEATLDLVYNIILGLFIPAFALLTGWVVTLFM